MIELQVGDLDGLIREVRKLGVTVDDSEEPREAIVADRGRPGERQQPTPRVQTWLGKMTAKAATGAWQVGSQVGAQVLATLIMKYYGVN